MSTRLMRIVVMVTGSILLTSCSEVRTNDAINSYKYWSGSNPSDDIEVVNGIYWQSGHWTREYIVYLKLKPTHKWWNSFMKQNQLQLVKGDWTKPSDSPDWFQPTGKFEIYKHPDNFND